jgi:hypothetical protein
MDKIVYKYAYIIRVSIVMGLSLFTYIEIP